MMNDYPGLSIISSEFKNPEDIYQPVSEIFDVKISNQVEVIDDEIFFTPMLFEQIKENPFKNDERKFPVDFAFAREKATLLRITIPMTIRW
ncbi:MAG: hypothetical protein HC906_06510 [Bacteroidales bacterium]|nr:hypothetical protein [Bacteroidales bacterium]